MTPVLDQGSKCNSGWAFAAAGMLDSAALIAGYSLNENLSPQQLLDCVNAKLVRVNKTSGQPDVCQGVDMGTAFEYLYSTNRRYSVSQYPIYTEDRYFKRQCAINEITTDPLRFPIEKAIAGLNTEDLMKSYIKKVGPIFAYVYADSWKYITGPVIDSKSCNASKKENNHAVVIVGWDNQYEYNGKRISVWIVKNSWGTEHGDVFFIPQIRIINFYFFRTDTIT